MSKQVRLDDDVAVLVDELSNGFSLSSTTNRLLRAAYGDATAGTPEPPDSPAEPLRSDSGTADHLEADDAVQRRRPAVARRARRLGEGGGVSRRGAVIEREAARARREPR